MAKSDEVVKAYIAFRDEIKRIEEEAKEKTIALKEKMIMLEGWLLKKADESGEEGFRTAFGTVSVVKKDFASVADWGATLPFIQETGRWELLTHAVNKLEVRKFLQETQAIIPGVNYGVKRDVQVRRPSNKGDSTIQGDSEDA